MCPTLTVNKAATEERVQLYTNNIQILHHFVFTKSKSILSFSRSTKDQQQIPNSMLYYSLKHCYELTSQALPSPLPLSAAAAAVFSASPASLGTRNSSRPPPRTPASRAARQAASPRQGQVPRDRPRRVGSDGVAARHHWQRPWPTERRSPAPEARH